MIVGDSFIWLHFPKCAGVAFEAGLRGKLGHRSDIHFDERNPDNAIWHHNLAARAAYDPSFDPAGRTVFGCFRRLPSWLLSRTFFEMKRNPHLEHTREMLTSGEFYIKGGGTRTPDQVIGLFADDVHHWMRSERLEEDFRTSMAPLLPDIRDTDEPLFPRRNATSKIDRNVRFYFTPAEIARLYDAAPLWAQIEEKVYGSLL